MKRYIYTTLIIFTLFFSIKIILFAEETLEKSWFELYEQRVEDICADYNPEKKVIKTEWYKKAEWAQDKYFIWAKIRSTDEFKNAKEIYENNMNSIYKCAILNTQITTLKLLKEDIVKISKNPDLSALVDPDLDNQINKIEISIKKLNCNSISENNEWIQKLNILKQTTFELCSYHSYLEYLREYNSNYENVTVLDDNTDYNSMHIVNLEKYRKEQIDNEINHIYKVYPLAFNAYKQYEDNLSTHILLGLIKDDYKLFRDNLHKVLNPLNQVVYKISNAMKTQ